MYFFMEKADVKRDKAKEIKKDGERQGGRREGERKRFSVHGFTPQIDVTARAESI